MGQERKRILIVSSEFPPQPGGIGNHAYNLALYLSKQKYIVTVIADQRSEDGEEETSFDQKLPFSIVRIKRYNLRFIMYLKRIFKTYRFLKNTSSVIATGKFSLWNVSFLSFFCRVQTLAVIHGSEVNFKSASLKKSIDIALKRMDIVIAVSTYTKKLVAHLNREVYVIPNGINLKDWEISNISKKSIPGNPSITTVGRISERKGQLNVIKKLPVLLKKFPELHYHCIGIPSQEEAFTQVAKDLKVDSHITFHGSLDHEHMKEILSKSDIFVMLSSESKTGDVEGFGIAILEANALGVPAIGSINCGIEDAINPNHSGILIDTNNTIQFENATTAILKDKNDFKSGAQDWAKRHNWSNIVKQYIRLIE
ncbi:glycosyltransferase family 4 protein [uncultured Winogradskyella sp.]|uniref:glycosyltransferase family 4 protein n=1 Tax=uncultured Winogradskyella sp. TaxID=395353 RepID=UPI0026317878|nr:glycosyltransferase family 4 protein [uncultured Winogradskyella sp.]